MIRITVRRLLPALAATILLALSAVSAGAFEGDSGAIGGPGGQPFHDQCNMGQNGGPRDAVAGIGYKTGKDLDRVRAQCQDFAGTYSYYTDWRGGPSIKVDGSTQNSGRLSCPGHMVVQALHGTQSAVRLVHNFWLTCRDLTTGEHVATKRVTTSGGRGGPEGVLDCGDDGYVSGILGGAYANVDRLGIICTAYQPNKPNTPPPVDTKPAPEPPPQPKPDKPPLKVNNGDTGASASANTDTTIYDKPEGSDVAHLSDGDPVTIVKCRANNWCQISAPEAGWVWADDLDR